MQTRRLIARFALAASFALVAIAAPATALAAPTGSNISEPADPSFVDYVAANPTTLHVAGTTSGGSGNVDLVCYGNQGYNRIATNVTVASGSFAIDLPVDQTLFSKVGGSRYCVLRAVPTGTYPAAQPGQPSPFEGPHIGWGEQREYSLGPAGAPNPPDTIYDAYTAHIQARGFLGYYGAGDCALCDSAVLDPLTYKQSNRIWFGNAALYNTISGEGPSSRSDVQVDGVNVYDPGALDTNGATFKDNPGYPSLTISRSVDPLTGDLTIHETDPFVPCEPQPAALPISDATCPSFGAPPVTLDRTFVQDHQGLQVKVVDHWHSNDATAHQLDAYYDDLTDDWYASLAGHESRLDFEWTCDGFKSYAAGTDIAPPPGAPATVYVQTDATTPEAGDGKSPYGALTYASAPDGIHVVRAVAPGVSSTMDWLSHYVRTIPASGDLVIEQVYSMGIDLPSVKSLAHEAEQALPSQGSAPAPCAPPADAAAGDGSPTTTDASVPAPVAPIASATAPPTAPQSVKCRVPKLRGRTLARAKRLLRHANCRLGRVTRKPTAGVRAGRVVRSTPRAGSTRPAGARVAVRVAVAV